MKTMGQAVDIAIAMHAERYPGSDVYDARVTKTGSKAEVSYRVEVDADHFSQPLVYLVTGKGFMCAWG